MGKYYQPEIETASREEILRIQNEKIVKQVKHVYENVPYYRDLMDKKGVKPEDIKSVDDIKKLPFLSKEDLREAYPYGLLATDIKDCVRIQSTSGTTGKRVVAFYTQHDVDLWEECTARAIVAVGGTEDDVCQVCYGYGLFTGGAGLHGGSHKVGCLTLPMSSGNTDRQIQFMMDLDATILCCTPSYAAYIGETLAEKGYKPEDNKLKAGIFGAEPWTEEMRRDIEKSLGIKAYDIYGLTESSGPGVAFECEEQSGMHINEDHFYAEIIDPDTGEVLPEGSKGAKQARLDYRILNNISVSPAPSLRGPEKNDSLILVEIHLHTGRHHQIRVQMANAGMPLCGDRKYGHPGETGQLALCAVSLELLHPATGKPMQFHCTPQGGYFELFEENYYGRI